jgi:IMP dehydrogenase/GMP reductase
MDTITRAAMAVVLAEEGGISVIDRGFALATFSLN